MRPDTVDLSNNPAEIAHLSPPQRLWDNAAGNERGAVTATWICL